MHHRLTHDDRLRLLRATLSETSSDSEQVFDEPPVQLHRALVNRAAIAQPSQLAWRRRAAGSIRGLNNLMRGLRAK